VAAEVRLSISASAAATDRPLMVRTRSPAVMPCVAPASTEVITSWPSIQSQRKAKRTEGLMLGFRTMAWPPASRPAGGAARAKRLAPTPEPRQGDQPGQLATTETVTLSPLPCWEHLSPEQIRERVGAIVQRIEETAAKGGREESSSAVLGAAAVRAQKPFD
jgi:hypothetical protein